MLLHWLAALWKINEEIKLVALDNEFYLMGFNIPDNYFEVLVEHPWFIGHNFITILPWEPKFNPAIAT